MTSKEAHTELLAVDAEPGRFTTAQLYNSITREIAMRLSVYPKQIATGKIKLEDAKQELAMMKTIRRLIELSSRDMHAGRNQFDLFRQTE